MAAAATQPMIKTRFLILSDTHGEEPLSEANGTISDEFIYAYRHPLPSADVVIHCGDLTYNSTPDEFRTTFDALRAVDAPLKLVIPGNHDSTLDTVYWERRVALREGTELAEAWARLPAQTAALAEQARRDGVLLLDEGTYDFVLQNGARLRVFASQWTPAFGGWGFQYMGAHDFAIRDGTDVVMTHGPPKHILDEARAYKSSAGCRHLLASVARARPRLHCFGHIHEAWGAKLVTWADGNNGDGSDVRGRALVDEDRTVLIENLASLQPTGADGDAAAVAKMKRRNEIARHKVRATSVCAGDEHALEYGKQTLFVNAAIMSTSYHPVQLPWLVDLELPEATEEDIRKAPETRSRILAEWTVQRQPENQ